MERCSDCGEAFTDTVGLRKHRERCTGSTADAVAGSFGDGSCPMCGDAYNRYIQHLYTCEAAGSADRPGEGSETEVAADDAAATSWR